MAGLTRSLVPFSYDSFMTNASKAMILGCSGTRLTAEEKAFFRAARPWGFILFGRNVESLDQVRALTAELRESVGRHAPVLIDQEGGTVRRLRPPLVRDYPAAASIGRLYERSPVDARDAAYAAGRLMAADLASAGIDVDCAPVLDIPPEPDTGFIANRAFGAEPEQVCMLAQAMADGLKAGGVLPVVKHMPGHGRGLADSHVALPVVKEPLAVLAERDFRPFREIKGILMAMTCHVLFTAIDSENPASTSPRVVSDIMRGMIGFDGLIISDDISMNALAGTIADRARAVAAADVDIILHCNGRMAEMVMVAEAAPTLGGAALLRTERIETARPVADNADLDVLSLRLDSLLQAGS